MPCVSAPLLLVGGRGTGVCVPETVGDFWAESVAMVDWEEVREKVLARGPRWVSLSSEQVNIVSGVFIHKLV